MISLYHKQQINISIKRKRITQRTGIIVTHDRQDRFTRPHHMSTLPIADEPQTTQSLSPSRFLIQYHQSTHYHLSNKNNHQDCSSEILVKIITQHCYLASFKLNHHHQKIDRLTSQLLISRKLKSTTSTITTPGTINRQSRYANPKSSSQSHIYSMLHSFVFTLFFTVSFLYVRTNHSANTTQHTPEIGNTKQKCINTISSPTNIRQ